MGGLTRSHGGLPPDHPNRQNHKRAHAKRNRTFESQPNPDGKPPSAETQVGEESVVCSYAAKRLCGDDKTCAHRATIINAIHKRAFDGIRLAHVGGEKLATA